MAAKTIITNTEQDAARFSGSQAVERILKVHTLHDWLDVVDITIDYRAGIAVKKRAVTVARYKLRRIKLPREKAAAQRQRAATAKETK